MDSLKRRIIELIDNDRYRSRGHFFDGFKERKITVEDAIRVLRNGIQDRKNTEIDIKLGKRYRFHGIDYKDRRIAVVVGIDVKKEILWLITAFELKR